MTTYPLSALRTLALHTQRLDVPNGSEPDATPDAIYDLVEHLGNVQIDTLQRVDRAHYVTIWTRLGNYDHANLDQLVYTDERRLWEYWGHAASLMPLTWYRYRMADMAYHRERGGYWWHGWYNKPENRKLTEGVYETLRKNGPMRAGEFEVERKRSEPWWGWNEAKRALEMLFAFGDVMVKERPNFQRVYDLAERVRPEWVDTNPATLDEAYRFYVEHAILRLGVCDRRQPAEYAYLKRGESNPIVKDLLKEGLVTEIEGQLHDGSTATMIIHRDNLPLLEEAADDAITPQRTTFLTPFDSLFWAKDRDQQLWGFTQRLEAYKPKKDRIWGYFCLPILHHDRLVGRFDPKLDRKAGVLHLEALYLEPGIEPDDELVADVAAAMRDFLAFHDATEVRIAKSDPAEFGEKLLKALA